MKRKVLTIIAIGSIFLMALTGCGNSSSIPAKSDSTTTVEKRTDSSEVENIKEAEKETEEVKTEESEADETENSVAREDRSPQESTTFDDVLEENTAQLDYNESTPFQQTYWVIFTEGYRTNRVEASTFDSTLPAVQLSIIWDSALEINDSSESDGCFQYYLDDNGEWIYIGNYHRLSDKATNVLASNLDVVDRNGNIIISASPYSMIDWDEVDSFK